MTKPITSIADAVEVARCPFCGGKGDIDQFSAAEPWEFAVCCSPCAVIGPSAKTREEALAAWNRRSTAPDEPFQAKVQPWLMECFGAMIAGDREERNHRFLEEALELVQSCGCTANEAHQLVDYVYGRPVGDLHQEVGGVMVTLAALCLANDADMHAAGWVELNRVWGKVEAIRAKQASKPKHSPLPASPTAPDDGWRAAILAVIELLRPMSDQFHSGWYKADEMYAHDVARKAEREAKQAIVILRQALPTPPNEGDPA